jgi:hypothetical protein
MWSRTGITVIRVTGILARLMRHNTTNKHRMNERYHRKVQHTHSNMELKGADTSPGVRVHPIMSAAEFRTPTYAPSESEFGHNSDMETLALL